VGDVVYWVGFDGIGVNWDRGGVMG
jgi:hypothetical protein